MVANIDGVDRENTFVSIVHQATGMIAAQLNCDIAEATVRLRAHAFSTEQSVYEVSRSIVQREFRFD